MLFFCVLTTIPQLLRPDFANLLSKHDEEIIFGLITRLIDTMSSEKIAIDEKHTPKLWARFLQELITKHKQDGAMATIPPAERRVTLSKNPTPQNTLPAPPMSYVEPTMPQQYAPLTAQQMQDPATYAWPGQPETALYGALGLNPNIGMAVGPGLMQPLGMGDDMMVDEDQLATMAALNNPTFWENMMLPGYAFLNLAMCLIHLLIACTLDSRGRNRRPL